jgi:hypothetical protein
MRDIGCVQVVYYYSIKIDEGPIRSIYVIPSLILYPFPAETLVSGHLQLYCAS